MKDNIPHSSLRIVCHLIPKPIADSREIEFGRFTSLQLSIGWIVISEETFSRLAVSFRSVLKLGFSFEIGPTLHSDFRKCIEFFLTELVRSF